MKTTLTKSQFLCLAYQEQEGGVADHGRLDADEAEVWRLRGEIEASQKASEELLQREARAQSQIGALTSQVAGLKETMAVQEIELTSAGAARDKAEQGRRRLEAECQTLRSACAGEYSSACILLSFVYRGVWL